jgi:hypothetical protein
LLAEVAISIAGFCPTENSEWFAKVAFKDFFFEESLGSLDVFSLAFFRSQKKLIFVPCVSLLVWCSHLEDFIWINFSYLQGN